MRYVADSSHRVIPYDNLLIVYTLYATNVWVLAVVSVISIHGIDLNKLIHKYCV